jgi:hypothetical protein
MNDDLTRPERFAEIQAARAAKDAVKECGGCGACLNRDRAVLAWGRGVCGLIPTQVFPKCVGQTPGFQPDHAMIYAKDRIE